MRLSWFYNGNPHTRKYSLYCLHQNSPCWNHNWVGQKWQSHNEIFELWLGIQYIVIYNFVFYVWDRCEKCVYCGELNGAWLLEIGERSVSNWNKRNICYLGFVMYLLMHHLVKQTLLQMRLTPILYTGPIQHCQAQCSPSYLRHYFV